VNLLFIGGLIEPICLLSRIPVTFRCSVASLFCGEPRQDLRGLGRDPALMGSLNKRFL
jgi:hypothetical protein